MSSEFPSSTHKKRRKGQRMTSKERKETQEAFLKAYEKTANILTAAEQVGIDRKLVYYWLEHDEQFGFAYNLADNAANMNIEAEIHRRGVQGWQEPVWQMGQYCGKITKYSDTLLIFYAKRRMPEYRDHQHIEHSGSIDINGAKESLLDKLSRLSENSEISK